MFRKHFLVIKKNPTYFWRYFRLLLKAGRGR